MADDSQFSIHQCEACAENENAYVTEIVLKRKSEKNKKELKKNGGKNTSSKNTSSKYNPDH
jgi:hypothetical protein